MSAYRKKPVRKEVGEAMKPGKIISGGQTGVDRAALDFAKERGIERGGWAPKGWKAEDGSIPEEHRAFMRETVGRDYSERTFLNIFDSTATLILYDGRTPMSPGTWNTIRSARKEKKRHAVFNLHPDAYPVIALRRWVTEVLTEEQLAVLNIAGPRESKAPGIYAATLALLREVWP